MKRNQKRYFTMSAVVVYFAATLLFATPHAATEPSTESTITHRAWYTGDGLGVNITLYLRDDDTYRAYWDGCVGRYGSAAGTWSRTGDTLHLVPDHEDGMLQGFLSRLHLVSVLPQLKDDSDLLQDTEPGGVPHEQQETPSS